MQSRESVHDQLVKFQQRYDQCCREHDDIGRIKAAASIYTLSWVLSEKSAADCLEWYQQEMDTHENRVRERLSMPMARMF